MLLEDIDKEVKSDYVDPPYTHTNDILYADDTLISSSDRSHVQAVLNAIAHFGKYYGLQIYWSKSYLLRIGSDEDMFDAQDKAIKCKSNIIYLGGLLTADGDLYREITRRLGETTSIFKHCR